MLSTGGLRNVWNCCTSRPRAKSGGYCENRLHVGRCVDMKTIVLIKLPLGTFERLANFPLVWARRWTIYPGKSLVDDRLFRKLSLFWFVSFLPALWSSNCCAFCVRRVAVHHVKVKPRCAVLTMLKRLDKIRFRGPRTRDDFPDLAESPPASDNECSEDVQPKPRTALRDTEDLLRDPVSLDPFVFYLFLYYCYFKLFCLFFRSHKMAEISIIQRKGEQPRWWQMRTRQRHLYDKGGN